MRGKQSAINITMASEGDWKLWQHKTDERETRGECGTVTNKASGIKYIKKQALGRNKSLERVDHYWE